jgi:hypothetical protein
MPEGNNNSKETTLSIKNLSKYENICGISIMSKKLSKYENICFMSIMSSFSTTGVM